MLFRILVNWVKLLTKFHYLSYPKLLTNMKLKLLLLLIAYTSFAQVPAYYSNIDFTQNAENIKSQLATLITTTHTTELVYTSGSSGFLDTWTVLKQSDKDPDNAANVLMIYGWNDTSSTVSEQRSRDVNESCHTSSCTGKWVREHTFPKSIGTPNLGTEFAGADAHNLRAIDAQRNNTRSNKLFGAAAASTASFSINANSWYPGDEWRGDVARIVMYMYLRYPTQCAPINVATGPTTFAPLLDMPDLLLQWNAEDPPSTFELNRNNTIALNQGNRNPFIDNPYLATLIWNGPQTTDTWNVLFNATTSLSKIQLYPIQTDGTIYVRNDTGINLRYTLYNTIGQQLQEDILEQQIHLSNYASGIYLIQIKSNETTQMFKIFKK